jgi:pantoate--beta-alanine ligase
MQRLAFHWKREGRRVAFVPTMGCLHAGHTSLMTRARQLAGRNGIVAVSIYVNPAQFAPTEDFARYPRDLKRDTALCTAAGVDLLFVPEDREMYPPGADAPFSTCIDEEKLSRRLEGAARPSHFRGVTTVVAKLFNILLPDVAVFGAKDFQQAAIIRRMVRDLNFPVKIAVAPTVREPDGLALSSRNEYLSTAERAQATVLWEAIRQMRAAVRVAPQPAAALKKRVARLIAARPSARLDYVDFFHPGTLEPVSRVGRGNQMALAVFVGKTRLIDNARL